MKKALLMTLALAAAGCAVQPYTPYVIAPSGRVISTAPDYRELDARRYGPDDPFYTPYRRDRSCDDREGGRRYGEARCVAWDGRRSSFTSICGPIVRLSLRLAD